MQTGDCRSWVPHRLTHQWPHNPGIVNKVRVSCALSKRTEGLSQRFARMQEVAEETMVFRFPSRRAETPDRSLVRANGTVESV